MKKITLIIIPIALLFSSSDSIEDLKKEKERIQDEIKLQDKEIESLNKELQYIRKKITDTTNDLNVATQEAIKSQQDLLSIEKEINKTNTILKSIESDLSDLDISIYSQRLRISKQENKIDSIQEIITEIEFEFKKRTKKSYDIGNQSKTNWKQKKYLKELNRYVDKNDQQSDQRYRSEVASLDIVKKDFENILKDLEITLISKKKLYDFKKKTIKDLISKKKKKERILGKLKKQKNDLEDNLNETRTEERKKEKEIKTVEELISKLLKNKEKIKKRTDELIKIRLRRNKEISGNFSKMRGKLQWPVNGAVISKFGNQVNPELNTVTENIGIEIQCNKNQKVISVMDGIISLISYIPGHGNIIIIDHGDNYSTVYAHIEKILVNEDQYVLPGEEIAIVSNTNNKGRLHFEIWKGEQKINPETWLVKK
mgnify:CR=1 FL=1